MNELIIPATRQVLGLHHDKMYLINQSSHMHQEPVQNLPVDGRINSCGLAKEGDPQSTIVK